MRACVYKRGMKELERTFARAIAGEERHFGVGEAVVEAEAMESGAGSGSGRRGGSVG